MGDYTPQSRTEEILLDMIKGLPYTEQPQSRVEALLLKLKEVIESGRGTNDYDDLEHKPSINNVELSGDKSLADLGIASPVDSVTDGNMNSVTSNAVADEISRIRESFQDGVDEVYDAVVAKGSTPASHSLSDVIDGIGAIQTGIVPSGTKSITTNGTHDVTNYANASVNVPGIVPSGTKSITTNGTHDVTNYANANVNVPGLYYLGTGDSYNMKSKLPNYYNKLTAANFFVVSVGSKKYNTSGSELNPNYSGHPAFVNLDPASVSYNASTGVVTKVNSLAYGYIAGGSSWSTESKGQDKLYCYVGTIQNL